MNEVLKVLCYYCIPISFSFYVCLLYIIRCSFRGFIYVNGCNILFLYDPFYHYIRSSFLYGLCFKACFIWQEYATPCFLVISVFMKYLFPSLNIKSVYVLCPKVSLIGSMLQALVFSSSLPRCVLIEAFSLLTLKVIIDKICIYCHFKPCFPIGSMFLCSFLSYFLWLDDFLLSYACVLCFFVSLLYAFDLWLPCFSSILTPSYIYLLQTDSHIGSNTFF